MKIINKHLYQRLMIIGSILVIVSILLGFFVLFRVYGEAGGDLGASSSQSLHTDRQLVNIVFWLRGIGIITLTTGVILFIARQLQSKQR